MIRILAIVLAFTFSACGPTPPAGSPPRHIEEVAAERKSADLLRPLIDPEKLKTLGERGANPRFNKAMGILLQAKQEEQEPMSVIQAALPDDWRYGRKGNMTVAALICSFATLLQSEAATPEDLEALRHGRCATIRTGELAGHLLSVDHFIPRSVWPEGDNVIANLRLMPLPLNQAKADKIGPSELAYAERLLGAGLMTPGALARVKNEAEKQDAERGTKSP